LTEGAPQERASPFPYAEDFDEWVADETAAPDRPASSEERNEQTEGDPDTDDRDAQERDSSEEGNEHRELGPLEEADEWGKDVPERGHGEDIA